MAQQAVTGVPTAPMPVRVSAWAIYDVFETARADEQLFVGVVTDSQWQTFCKLFDLGDIGTDPDLAANNQRVLARDRILPVVRALRSEEHTSELQSLMRISYAVFCLKKNTHHHHTLPSTPNN